MTSRHGPLQPQRDELSAAPGEDVGTWVRRVHARAIIDPLLLAQERARQEEARRQFEIRSRQRIRRAVRWLVASLLAQAAFGILHQAAGLSWWLVAAGTVAVVVSAGAAARAGRLKQAGTAAITPGPAPGRNQIVRLTELDEPSRGLLNRARQSITEAFSSLDRLGGEIDRHAVESMLREREWDLARVLRKLTRERARYDADPAARRDGARRALENAQDHAATLVSWFGELAARLKDASVNRHQDADGARRLNDGALDLAALTETVLEPAIQQIRELTETLAEIQGEAGEDS